MAVLRTAKFISTDAGENKNRYWFGFKNDDSTVKVEWGRVGETSQSKSHEFTSDDEAERFLTKKCNEKRKKGYKELQLMEGETVVVKDDLRSIAKDQIKAGCPIAKSLIDELLTANVHSIVSQTTITYNKAQGVFSTPLGVVTPHAIQSARELLAQMQTYVDHKEYTNHTYVGLVNEFLMLVPQNVGRKLDPARLFPDKLALHRQQDILDSLEASVGAVTTKKGKTRKVFDLKLAVLQDEWDRDRIKSKYRDTRSDHHESGHLDVKEIYTVDMSQMRKAFEQRAPQVGGVGEYWHGTRKANMLSILHKGLIIPPKDSPMVRTGRLLGDGIYFADRSTKSLNYAYGTWDGQQRDEEPLMFLAMAALGKIYTAKNCQTEDYPVRGYDSVFGKSDHTRWYNYQRSREETLKNNEYVIYDPAQCNLTYLIKFSHGGK